MSITGIVKDGVVVPDSSTPLPEGAVVQVTLVEEKDPFDVAVREITKPRPHLPDDYSLNHRHYLNGEPQK